MEELGQLRVDQQRQAATGERRRRGLELPWLDQGQTRQKLVQIIKSQIGSPQIGDPRVICY